jgi:hypothetical protein
MVPLDFADAEGELHAMQLPDPYNPDAQFRTGWIRSLFIEAVARLQHEYRASGKDHLYDVFERYDLTDRSPGERMTYAQVGRELDLTATQVNNALASARRRLRRDRPRASSGQLRQRIRVPRRSA